MHSSWRGWGGFCRRQVQSQGSLRCVWGSLSRAGFASGHAGPALIDSSPHSRPHFPHCACPFPEGVLRPRRGRSWAFLKSRPAPLSSAPPPRLLQDLGGPWSVYKAGGVLRWGVLGRRGGVYPVSTEGTCGPLAAGLSRVAPSRTGLPCFAVKAKSVWRPEWPASCPEVARPPRRPAERCCAARCGCRLARGTPPAGRADGRGRPQARTLRSQVSAGPGSPRRAGRPAAPAARLRLQLAGLELWAGPAGRPWLQGGEPGGVPRGRGSH